MVRTTSGGDSASNGRNGGAEASSARSTLPARTARTSAGVLPSRVVTAMPGWSRRSAARARGTSTAPALVYQPSRTAPEDTGRPASSRAVASISSSTTPARRSTTRPASVSRTPSCRRCSSTVPAARSRAATCRDTADWV